jgi:hypothetical protein
MFANNYLELGFDRAEPDESLKFQYILKMNEPKRLREARNLKSVLSGGNSSARSLTSQDQFQTKPDQQ